MEKEKAEVIDFFTKKRSMTITKQASSSRSEESFLTDFEDIFQSNLLKEEKMKKQRQLDNEKVLKSYKIKK